jgi:hypothetical protein
MFISLAVDYSTVLSQETYSITNVIKQNMYTNG